jgi:hypothetical protein
VLYRDQIVLLNVKTNLYLHITERWLSKEIPPALPVEDWRPDEPDRREQPESYIQR